jgi:hypothetical protein
MIVPKLFDAFAAAVRARPDLLEPYAQIARIAEAGGWTEERQQAHLAIRQQLVRIGAYAVFQADPRFGLLKKGEGNTHGTRPQDGKLHAVQILAFREGDAPLRLVQVLSDLGPEWAPLDENDTRPVSDWIQPLPEPGAVVVPPPTVPPQPDPLPAPVPDDVTARLDRIEQALLALALKPAPAYSGKAVYAGFTALVMLEPGK